MTTNRITVKKLIKFCSARSLRSVLQTIASSFIGKRIPLQLSVPGRGSTYTDFKSIHVSLDENFLKEAIQDKVITNELDLFSILRGLTAHEAEHNISTHPDAKKDMYDYFMSLYNSPAIGQLGGTILNIVEDRRIERIASNRRPGIKNDIKFMNYALSYSTKAMKSENLGEPLDVIISDLIHFVLTGKLRKGWKKATKGTIIAELSPMCINELIIGSESDDQQGSVDATLHINDLLSHLIAKKDEDMKAQQKIFDDFMQMLMDAFGAKGDSTGNPKGNGGGSKPTIPGKSTGKPVNGPKNGEAEKGDSNDDKGQASKGDKDQNESPGTPSSAKNGGDTKDDNPNQSETQGDKSDDNIKDDSEDKSNGGSDDKTDDNSDDKNQNTGDSLNSEERENPADSIDESSEDDLDNSREEATKEIEDAFKHIARQIAIEDKEELAKNESLTRQEIMQILSGTRSDIVITHSNESRTEYVDPEILKQGKRIEKDMLKLLRSRKSEIHRFKRSGKLDNKSFTRFIGKKEGDIFKTCLKQEVDEVCVYTLIDDSGSMKSKSDYVDFNGRSNELENTVFATRAANIIEIGFKNICPLKIARFTDDLSIIKNFEEKSKLYLSEKHKSPWEGNSDGLALQIATKELLKRNEAKKIIFVISDGLPSTGFKNGPVEDLQEAVAHAKKNGVKVVAIAIAADTQESREKYLTLYKDNVIFCNPSELATSISKTLQKLISIS